MERRDLERRTKNFALRIVRFVSGLPKNKGTDVLGYQLLKSGTSVGANYREANRAASHDDFIFAIRKSPSAMGHFAIRHPHFAIQEGSNPNAPD